MYQWRITKYDPQFRNELGQFTRIEWIGIWQVGHMLDGHFFTKEEYLAVESAYLAAALACFNESGVPHLVVTGLQRNNFQIPLVVTEECIEVPDIDEGTTLTGDEICAVCRLVLREAFWCRLEFERDFFIHFGWDYYMYCGCSKPLRSSLRIAESRGLFVEPCNSPYYKEPFTNVIREPSPDGTAYRCPCCGYRTLDERGGYEICSVCFWEDDGQDDHDADEVRGGPNHDLSLKKARQNFREYGACCRKMLPHVRKPKPEEM